jgi:uncharacterized protein (TIGR03067 family)
MKIPTLLSIFSLAGVLATFAGPKADDTKDIQGTWLPVKAELAGKPMPEEFLKKIVSLKLDGGKYVVTAESLDKGTYTMDAAAKLRTIEITGTEGPNVGKKIPAIYELNGDTLRICYNLGGDSHPTEFKSPAGTKIFLVTYQRKKA